MERMPSNCVICGNSAMKDPGVSFHRLPSSADRKRQWLEAFDVPEEEWCTHWRVCSRHFPDGNPKAAPLSYREDHFANMWSLRKRAKLDHSRSATPARQPQPQQLQQQQQQVKRNNLNSILALRGGPALSRPLPVINNTASMEEQATVHARPPPVLLPVASLPPNHHLVGGPITVITREPLNLVPTSSQHQLHKGVVPGGIHVHELVVVPEVGPSDEATSESSGTDESLTTGAREGGGSGGDYEVAADIDSGEHVLELTGGNNMTGYYRGSTSSGEGEAAQRINHTGSSPAHAVSRINHTGLSSTPCSTASRTDRVVQSGEGRDVSVMVQSALLAHVAVLENDNRQLRQKVTTHNPVSHPVSKHHSHSTPFLFHTYIEWC